MISKKLLSFTIIILAVIVVIISLSSFVNTSQDEITQIENELEGAGYSWLSNYTLNASEINYTIIEVYEFNQTTPFAVFDNISSEGWYKIYLTNLSNDSSYSQDVFDLKVLGGVEFDYVVDPQISSGDSGLLALYHFNNESAYGENATKVYDFAGGRYNGTVVGGAVWNASGGILGTGAYQFDGTDDYINLPKILANRSEFTVSMWANYMGPATSDVSLMGTSGGGFYLRNTGADNRIYIYLTNSSTTGDIVILSSGGITSGMKMYTFAINRSGWLSYYRDGALIYNRTLAGWDNFTSTFDNYLGQYAASSYFNGTIDEVAIYNRSLNSSEISALYGTTTTGQYLYSCGNLTTANQTYYLASNVIFAGTCFNILANNVTLDGQGYTINYSAGGIHGYAINVTGYNYTTIKNTKIIDNAIVTPPYADHAINLFGANYVTVYNNTAVLLGNNVAGVSMQGCNNGNITGNNFTRGNQNGGAIYLTGTSNNNYISNNYIYFLPIEYDASGIILLGSLDSNNTIINNVINGFIMRGIVLNSPGGSGNTVINNSIALTGTSQLYGIALLSQTNATLSGNKVNTTRTSSYYISGTTLLHFNHSIDSTNLAEGKPVIYNYNLNNKLQSYPKEVITTEENGLVALWHLNNDSSIGENSTFVVDNTGRYNATVLTGASYNSSGKIRGAYTFNGGAGFVNTSQPVMTVTDNLTFGGWFKSYSSSQDTFLLFNGLDGGTNGYAINIQSGNGHIYVYLPGQNIADTGYTMPVNTWTHLIVERDRGLWKLYVNGALVNGDVFSSQYVAPNTPTGSTKLGSTGTTSFIGSLDEIVFYNRTLSSSEVKLLYENAFNDTGQIICAWCTNVTYNNITMLNGDGITLANSSNSKITNSNLTSSKGYGVYIYSNGQNNLVENNTINTNTNSYLYPVYVSGGSYHKVIRNNISATGTEGSGIYLLSSVTGNYNFIDSNSISVSGANAFGIYPLGQGGYVANDIISNNVILATGSSFGGVGFQGVNNILFANNSINATTYYGIQFYWDPSNITVSGLKMYYTGYYDGTAFYLRNANGNIVVYDSMINSSFPTSAIVYSETTSGTGIWNFTNVTKANGQRINISWQSGANGTLNYGWWLDLNTTDPSGNPSGNSVVNATASNGAVAWSGITTNSNGTTRQILLEYTQNGTSGVTKTYYSNYTIRGRDASGINHNTVGVSLNMSTNRQATLQVFNSVSACGMLSTANSYYLLVNNVSSLGNCFNITANNVTLDGNGYTMNYSSNGNSANGINIYNVSYPTVKNLRIVGGATGNYYSIYLSYVHNATIRNVTFADNPNYYDLWVDNTNSSLIINNLFYGSAAQHLTLSSNTYNNNITGNIFLATGGYAHPIMMGGTTSYGNIVSFNNITSSVQMAYGGPILVQGGGNIYFGNNISSQNGISFRYYNLCSTPDCLNNSIDSTNLVEGKPVSYVFNGNGLFSDDFKEIKTTDSGYTDKLVVLYHFNNKSTYGENATFVVDSASGIYNGTVNGSIYNSSGKINGAYQFNGVNSSIKMDYYTGLITGAFTVSSWIKSASNTRGAFVSKYGNTGTWAYRTYMNSSGKAVLERAGTSVQSTSLVNDSRWHLVTGVYDNSSIKIYVDGTLENTVTYSGEYTDFSNNFCIGYDSYNCNTDFTPAEKGRFNGSIDEVAIWNRSLSASEIRSVYQKQIGDFGQMICAGCNNVTYSGLNLTNGDGIFLVNTSNSKIINSNLTTSKGYGVYIYSNGQNNLIENNTINTSTNTYLYGIFVDSSSYNNFSRNNIYTSSDGSYGIYMSSTSNDSLANNYILTTGANNAYGLSFEGLSRSNIINNSVFTTGVQNWAVWLAYSSNYNNFFNNTFNTSSSGASALAWRYDNLHNIFTGNIYRSYRYPLYIFSQVGGSSNNTFTREQFYSNEEPIYVADSQIIDFSIRDSIVNSSLGYPDFRVGSITTGGVWNLTNVTRADGSAINVSWESGAVGTLNYMWYMDVNASYQNGQAISGAVISGSKSDGVLGFNVTTNANGTITRQTVLEYMQNGSQSEINNTDNGLIALYHFNNNTNAGETSTKIIDSAAGRYNASCSGSTCPNFTRYGQIYGAMTGWSGLGSSGKSLVTPINNYFGVGDESKDLSITTWFKPEGPSYVYGGIVFARNGWPSGMNAANNYIACEIDNSSNTQFMTIYTFPTYNQWYHISCVYNGTSKAILMYINGNLTANTTFVGQMRNYATINFTIGGSSSGTSNMNGSIDELAIYNRTLSSSDVQILYQKAASKKIYSPYTVSGVDSYNNRDSKYVETTRNNIDNGNVRLTLANYTTSCGTLNTANGYYLLSSNLTVNGTCFIVSANNVTLDGNGYTINYGDNAVQGYGVYVNRSNFTVIKNIRFYDINRSSTSGNNYAIYFSVSNNGSVTGNTFNSSAYEAILQIDSSYSVLIKGNEFNGGGNGVAINYIGGNHNVTQNNFTCYGNNGVIAIQSDNTEVSNNIVNEFGGGGPGIYINPPASSGGKYINVVNNNITLTGSGAGIYSNGANSSRLINNTIYLGNAPAYLGGIYLYNSENMTLKENKIENYRYVGIYMYGSLSSQFNHSIDSTNLVEGKPVLYNFNAQNKQVSDLQEIGTADNYQTSGLVALYHLNNNSAYGENSSKVYDFAGGIYNATCSGSSCPTFNSSGKLNGAMEFDGFSKSLATPTLGIGRNFSLSFWVNFRNWAPSSSYYNTIIGALPCDFGSLIGICIAQGGGPSYMSFIVANGSTSNSLAYPDSGFPGNLNEWNMYSLVSNGTTLSLYVNGIYNKSSLITINNLYFNYSYYLGYPGLGTSSYLNGSLDEFAIWNRSLSASEIKAIYDKQVSKDNFGQMICAACNNVTYSGLNLTDGDGISLVNTSNSKIINSNLTTSKGYGVYIYNNGQGNTVENNTINTNTNSELYGVYVILSNYNNITGNNISTSGASGYGIQWIQSNNGTINGNVINPNGYGIYLVTNSKSNSILYNKIISSVSANGIYVYSGSNNNLLSFNNVSMTGPSYVSGLSIYTSNNNLFSNNILNVSGTIGISLTTANNNSFINDTILGSGSGNGIYLTSGSNNNSLYRIRVFVGGSNPLYIDNTNTNFTIIDSILNSTTGIQFYVENTVTGGEWNFTNVTKFNGQPINVSWQTGANGTLNSHYYVDINVSNSTSALSGVNVSMYRNNNVRLFSELTDSNGRIARKTILEYTRNSSTITNYNNHTLDSLLLAYSINQMQVNVSNNRNVAVVLNGANYTSTSSLGFSTLLYTVNYNENVNVSIDTASQSAYRYNFSSVWAEIIRPDNAYINISLRNSSATVWNASYTNPSILGRYRLNYYANLTTGFYLGKIGESGFEVKNTTIIINVQTITNTTDTIPVSGRIRLYNGSALEDLASNSFVIKLNNVTVSSATLGDNNFSLGNATNITIGNNLTLLLNYVGSYLTYSDDYSTLQYLTDAYNYSNVGYYGASGYIFELDSMTSPVGNITYQFNSPTKFFSANVTFNTVAVSDGNGNSSVWYSTNGVTFIAVNSTRAKGANVTANLNVANSTTFYVRLMSDTFNNNFENPITNFAVSYRSYQYAENGNFTSKVISLPNITYTTLKWDRNLSDFGDVKLQLRESDDGITWSAWSSNYTNYLVNSITEFSKQYIQYQVLLSTSNLSRSPVFYAANISFFNASTNSTGGYAYNITIPTDSIGSLPLEVSVVRSAQGIVGLNTTNIAVWARTTIPYTVARNYTQSNANYSVNANFTRTDTGVLVNGTFNFRLYNSSNNYTGVCYGSSCYASWLVPGDVSTGNFSIEIKTSNESAYYLNATTTYSDYLEARNTTGNLSSTNKIIDDFVAGEDYVYLWNVTLNNTGNASMNNPYVYAGAKSPDVKNVTLMTTCSRLYPGNTCNVIMQVVVNGGASSGTYFVTWRSNWTDNDGSIAGGAGFLQYSSFIDISLNAVLDVSNNSFNLTAEHGTTKQFSFNAESIGTDDLANINITYTNATLPASWITLGTDFIGGLASGQNQQINVNVSVPLQTAPGNYTGSFLVDSENDGNKTIDLRVEVLTNTSWLLTPTTNNTYNNTYALNAAGEIGNYTIFNTGNVNQTYLLTYSHVGTNDYTLYPGLIDFDKSTYVNPTSVLVRPGENITFTLYQDGWSETLVDLGMRVSIANSSSVPTSRTFEERFNILEQLPNVTNVWFYYAGAARDYAELNNNVTIKLRGTDDVGLNRTYAVVNVSHNDESWIINATGLFSVFGEYVGGAKKTVLNYTANFSSQFTGLHSAYVIVYDEIGQSYTSPVYTFNVYGTTTASLTKNLSNYSTQNINSTAGERFNVQYRLNNTGLVYAYNPILTFTHNSNISIGPDGYSFSSLTGNSLVTQNFEINISALTPPGNYTILASYNYLNPDTSVGSGSTSFNISVLSNKSLILNPSTLSNSIGHGANGSFVLRINNTGNDLLSNIVLSCYSGNICGNMTFTFNESSFVIFANKTRSVNISVSVPRGREAGTYSGTILLSEASINATIPVNITVSSSISWNISPSSINSTKAVSQSGNLGTVTVENLGNVPIGFNILSLNDSLVQANQTNISVGSGRNGSILLTFSSPSEPGLYNTSVIFSNTSYSPSSFNVSINLAITNLNISILSPTTISPVTEAFAGDVVRVIANASYEGATIDSNSSWSVMIGDSVCSDLDYSFDNSTKLWLLDCTIPSVGDGASYNISATITHDIYGEVTSVMPSAVVFSDLSPPVFNNISRNNVDLGNAISISANITDNVGVSSVYINVTYPNGSVFNYPLSLISGVYVLVGAPIPTEAGEYLVNYTARDAKGNSNSTSDWFEVLDEYSWTSNLRDRNNGYLEGIGIYLYRPNTRSVILSNTTDSEGSAAFMVNKRFYDLVFNFDKIVINILNVNYSNQSDLNFGYDYINGEELNEIIELNRPFIGFASNSTAFENYSNSIRFNYSNVNYDVSSQLKIIKCGDWDYASRECDGTWTNTNYSINRNTRTLEGNSSGFSAYFLTENMCGNGLCESTFAESASTCSADCQEGSSTTIINSGSSGGGGGGSGYNGLTADDIAKIEKIVRSYVDVNGIKIETTSIYKELFAGDSTTFRIRLINTLTTDASISIEATGDAKEYITFPSSVITFAPGEVKDSLVQIVVPKFTKPLNYDGDLVLSSGGSSGKIPTTIRVLSPEGKLLDVKIQPLRNRVQPGDTLRLQTDLLNLGKTKRVDVQFNLQLIGAEDGKVYAQTEEAFAIETSTSVIKEFVIPSDVPVGNYIVKGTAYYSSLEDEKQQASSLANIVIDYPFYKKKILFMPGWMLLLIIAAIFAMIGLISYINYLNFKKKRFKTKIEFDKLPQPAANSGFVGKIAETDVRSFIDLNKLQMHTLIAGATGGGKTIAAQDIVEEALLHNKSVIVFDPTSQWTGFLKKNEDSGMLRRYKYFNMNTSNVRGFNGTIKVIKDPYELINIKNYVGKPGEITIFDISRLTPKEIDVVVASTIEQVFLSRPEESKDLKTLLVYDEVHRLLPKFGGSGQGFIQLERGAREFRKWGIGLLLISQVLSDFIGEIKANIGTEIQMGTRYETDLERVSVKYGEDILKSVVKEPIGTGMFVNAEYNSGRPYFISFRPLLHSTKKLSSSDVEIYQKYFAEVEDLEYQIAQLKEEGLDVIDFELEMRLAKQKVKEGQFPLAEMYLESLRPRIIESWKSINKKPRHMEVKRISEEEIKKGLSIAESARAKYIKQNPQKEMSLSERILELSKLAEGQKEKGKDTSKSEEKIADLKMRIQNAGELSKEEIRDLEKEINSIYKEVKK